MGILRLILALSVVSIHTGSIFGLHFVGGKVAVQAFYIVSGFYMTLILNTKYASVPDAYRLFISNRFLRLFPVYWVVFVLALASSVFLHVLFVQESSNVVSNYADTLLSPLTVLFLLASNVFLFGQDLTLFMGLDPSGSLFFTSHFDRYLPQVYTFLWVPQAWSLSIELAFYLIAPFVVRRKTPVILAIMGVSFAARMVAYAGFDLKFDPWTYRFFPFELFFFLTGTLSYHWFESRWKTRPPETRLVRSVLAIVVFLTVFFFYLPATHFPFSPFKVREVLYFTVVAGSLPILFAGYKNDRLDNRIGELSYPVYIVHLWVASIVSLAGTSSKQSGWIVALLSVVVSVALNRWVSDPVERLRQSRVQKALEHSVT